MPNFIQALAVITQNMNIGDKLILIGLFLLLVVDSLICFFWLSNLYFLLGFIPIHFLNAFVLIKKPKNVIQPYSLIGGFYTILTIIKIITFDASPIWIVEYVISGIIGIMGLIIHVKNKSKLIENDKVAPKKDLFKVGLFVLIFGIILVSNYNEEKK